MYQELAIVGWDEFGFVDSGLELHDLLHRRHFLEEDGLSQLLILYAGVHDLQSVMHELQLWLIRLLAHGSQRQAQELRLQNLMQLQGGPGRLRFLLLDGLLVTLTSCHLLCHYRYEAQALSHSFIIIGTEQPLHDCKYLRLRYLLGELERKNFDESNAKIGKVLGVHAEVDEGVQELVGVYETADVLEIVHTVVF